MSSNNPFDFEQLRRMLEQLGFGDAEDLNLDMRKFQADASSPTAKTIIDRDMADADRSGLTGTPFLLINGREFDLGLFRPDADLEPWITMEIDLAAHRK